MVMYVYGQDYNGGLCSQPTAHKKDLKKYIYTDHGIVFLHYAISHNDTE